LEVGSIADLAPTAPHFLGPPIPPAAAGRTADQEVDRAMLLLEVLLVDRPMHREVVHTGPSQEALPQFHIIKAEPKPKLPFGTHQTALLHLNNINLLHLQQINNIVLSCFF